MVELYRLGIHSQTIVNGMMDNLMKLPEKEHFSLEELAERWHATVADVQYYAVRSMLEVETWVRVPAVRIKRYANNALASDFEGYAAVDPAELRRIFRGEETDLRIAAEDLVVSREERDRFERDHDIVNDAERTPISAEKYQDSALPVSFPGRPSVMRRIVAHFEERSAGKMLERSLQKESECLVAWAEKHIPDVQIPTSRTIRNAIRTRYREYAPQPKV